MVMANSFKRRFLFLWLAVFGVPFVLVAELFPMHRFGMFARRPNPGEGTTKAHLETKTDDEPWKKLETGNAYFDNGYFSTLAQQAANEEPKKAQLAQNLAHTLHPAPDSLRIVVTGMSGKSEVYPLAIPK